MFKSVIGAVAALSMVVMPAMASAATANPAASLSISKSVRSGTTTTGKSKLGGGAGIFAIAIVAGIVAIGVIAATKNDDVNQAVSR